MTEADNTYPRGKGGISKLIARIVALAAALALAATLAIGFGISQDNGSQAYATIHPAGESAQVDDQAAGGDTAGGDSDASGASDAEGAETEILDDEETPLSSGLGGGEPVSGGLGFGPIVIVGITAVALFFLVLMRRLNGNIKDMNRMFK